MAQFQDVRARVYADAEWHQGHEICADCRRQIPPRTPFYRRNDPEDFTASHPGVRMLLTQSYDPVCVRCAKQAMKERVH